ncbi:hypothetical protein E4U55_006978 [Claviceps digitariae]|nr:hypothetical protein E4U55_006978 [Claviceps digitariae]
MSSNPFRKKMPGTTDGLRTSSPKSSMRCDDHLGASDDRKNRPTRRVRVLSPPPLSPDASKWPHGGSQPPDSLSDDTFGFSNYHPTSDPFSGNLTDESDRDSTSTPAPAPAPAPSPQSHHGRSRATSNTTPANPFSKPFQHGEASDDLQKERKEEGEVLKAAHAGRRSLNVDAFRSLLMTGRIGDDAASVSTQRHGSSSDDKKSSTCHSVSLSNATPRTIHSGGDGRSEEDSYYYESQVEGDQEASNSLASSQQTNKDRKLAPRPPPPSSRHGKSLRQHESVPDHSRGADDTLADEVNARHQEVSALRRSLDDDAQLPSHRELGRGIPAELEEVEADADADADEPQPPAVRRDNPSKKSAPAPPPRRGHPRSDSRAADVEGSRQNCSAGEPTSRSESTRSSGSIPAPPPSRRPHTTPRQSSQRSASSVSLSKPANHAVSAYPLSSGNPLDSSSSKSPGPPAPASSPSHAPTPPPARQSSTRSREGPLVPPPPPPPRNRSGSGNNAAVSKKSSDASLAAQHAASMGKSAGILADLDALQKEVDALRGKMDEV